MNELLQWTFRKPTDQGAYFYRLSGESYKLAKVFWKNKELRAKLTGTYHEYPLSAMSGQWAGPIVPPEGTFDDRA